MAEIEIQERKNDSEGDKSLGEEEKRTDMESSSEGSLEEEPFGEELLKPSRTLTQQLIGVVKNRSLPRASVVSEPTPVARNSLVQNRSSIIKLFKIMN